MNYLIYFGSDIILYYDILKKKIKEKKKNYLYYFKAVLVGFKCQPKWNQF